MDYVERMNNLKELKSSLGVIDNSVERVDTEVADWIGGESKQKYQAYTTIVKEDVSELAQSRTTITTEIDKMITKIKKKFDLEYEAGKRSLQSVIEKDPRKKKQKRLEKLNSMSCDNSVKAKLRKNYI